jgi:uncharacterized protein YndB with AHSA1/START domain
VARERASTVIRSRTIAAEQQRVWEVVADPHHMSRWWPGVARVEGVDERGWTLVFTGARSGRPVRFDYHLMHSERPWRLAWEQDNSRSRVLGETVTEIMLEPEGAVTKVTVARRQKLRGYSRTGGLLVKRRFTAIIEEALEGLERICAEPPDGGDGTLRRT